MISKILKLSVVKYFILSCLASVIDFCLSYFSYKVINMNYLFSCNLGIFAGMIFHYSTSMKYIFKADDTIKSLITYLITFFLGLMLANGTMWVSYKLIYFSFFISKVLSMGVPFFAMYFVRKKFLGLKSISTVEGQNEDALQI